MSAWKMRSAGRVSRGKGSSRRPSRRASWPAWKARRNIDAPGGPAWADRVECHGRWLISHTPALAPGPFAELDLLAGQARIRPESELDREWVGGHAFEVDRIARAHDPRDVDGLVAELEQREKITSQRRAK